MLEAHVIHTIRRSRIVILLMYRSNRGMIESLETFSPQKYDESVSSCQTSPLIAQGFDKTFF